MRLGLALFLVFPILLGTLGVGLAGAVRDLSASLLRPDTRDVMESVPVLDRVETISYWTIKTIHIVFGVAAHHKKIKSYPFFPSLAGQRSSVHSSHCSRGAVGQH